MGERAILVVSFGTSHLDTMEKTIRAMEIQIAETFPKYRVYRAFTSQMILDKLRRTKNLDFDNVTEAMERMERDGIESVVVQPTHIIHGIENDRMLEDIRAFEGRFQRIRIGRPMLSNTEDYKKAIHAIIGDIHLEPQERLLLMGHGTEHHANAAYPALEYTFHALGYDHVYVGTVEGFPELNDVMKKLETEAEAAKEVVLLPFMFVAGDHAKNDMAGEEDSWKEALENAGYSVRPIIKGLGELPGIRKIFIEHIEEIM